MRLTRLWIAFSAAAVVGLIVHAAADSDAVLEEKLRRIRNLAKAYYENPTAKKEAVAEFKKALELNPDSLIDRLNYGLALIRAGRTEEGIAELKKVQEKNPSIPHTWFNLGIEYKKLGEFDKAIEQLEQMAKLVPDEAVTRYNLGVLYKRAGRLKEAIENFQLAAKLDPSLAAPHFQLFNVYRTSSERDKARQELEIFKKLKAAQKGAVVAEDMNWSFYSEVYEVIEPVPEESAPAELKFEPVELGGRFPAGRRGVVVLQAAAGGKPHAVVWSAGGARLYVDSEDPVENSGLEGLRGITSIAAADYDNDGLADLAVTTASGPVLLHNMGGRFERAAVRLPSAAFQKAVWLDYDHDNDLDLFLLGSRAVLMRNEGANGFSDRTADFPFAKGEAVDAVVIRVIPDTKMFDLVVSYRNRTGTLYKDRLAGQYEVRPLGALPPGATGLTVVDANNDSWFDLAYAAGGRAGLLWNRRGRFEAAEIRAEGSPVFADLENRGVLDLVAGGKVYRNLGLGRFGPAKAAAGLSAGVGDAADFDGDGRADLMLVGGDGRAQLLLNRTETSNRWIRIALNGRKAPKLAPMAEIEIKAGLRYQKRLYRGVTESFGVGPVQEIDTVRITWSNGLIQNAMRQKTNVTISYIEEERLSGSCPMIWTWDGERFRFITDVLGVGPLGVQIGNGQFFPADHDEYVQLSDGALAPRDGVYEVRLTQELAEVAYVDEVKLLAVDHPAGIEVFTNEKFTVPPPEFKLYGVHERAYPIAARDDAGRDVLERVLRLDERYVDTIPRKARRGAAAMHTLTLDFGDAAPANDAVLVLSGWTDWAEGSNYLGFSQEDETGLRPPRLEVRDQAGRWVTVFEDMGLPAGLPKTIVVDLRGKFLSRSREVRITTNMRIYWDEIFLAPGAREPEVRLTELRPAAADFRFRGFARIQVDPTGVHPQRFFYEDPVPEAPWSQTPGTYTRYGEVTELLTTVDDRYVIMGSGDEIRLRFDAAELPPLPEGWKRTFILGVDGWEKDQDPNTITSTSVAPLPFHGMSRYPYPETESYPDSPRHREYIEEYLTRPALRLIRPLAPPARPAPGSAAGE